MDGNNEYYFTFGIDHPLANFVQHVSAPNEALARRGMHSFYADRWSSCYLSEDVFMMVDGGRVALPMGSFMQRLPKKIVVDGDEIYTEQEANT